VEDVQRALAQVRTDLDSFCEVEAWSLMADAYQLTDKIVPTRAGLAALGTAGPDVDWPFEVVAEQLAQPSKKFLKLLRTSKQRFLKPARMVPPLLPLTLLLLVAALGAAAYGLWLLLTPHGTALFIAGLATLGVLVIYANSENKFVKPVAIGIFDVALPARRPYPPSGESTPMRPSAPGGKREMGRGTGNAPSPRGHWAEPQLPGRLAPARRKGMVGTAAPTTPA